jgi:hypothetical protein
MNKTMYMYSDFTTNTDTILKEDFLVVRGRLKSCLSYMYDQLLKNPEALSEFREFELNNTQVRFQRPLSSQDRYSVTCLEKERFLKKEDFLVVEKVLSECKAGKVSTHDENLAIERMLDLIPIDAPELKYIQQSEQDFVVIREKDIGAIIITEEL